MKTKGHLINKPRTIGITGQNFFTAEQRIDMFSKEMKMHLEVRDKRIETLTKQRDTLTELIKNLKA